LFCTTAFIFPAKGPVVSTINCPIFPEVAVIDPEISA
jgi:hypothetical protein